MILLALLLQTAAPPPPDTDIVVRGPAKANAQTPATLVVEPAAMLIAACDENYDARTSRSEMDTCLARTFAAADPGGTGSIGYLAYGDWALKWLGDRTALPSPYEIDRDGDNRITLDELKTQFSKLFTRYDKDKDSAVTRQEALTIRAFGADANGPVGGPGGRRRRDRPKGEPVPGGTP